ncbi:MAG: TonB-dependent receptor [Pseudomonadota bacterium]
MKKPEAFSGSRPAANLCLGIILALGLAVPMLADAAEQRSFSAAAGSLRAALNAVSETYSVNIMAADELIAGKRVEAVSGTFGPEGALLRVLQGTGLEVERSTSGVLVVVRAETQAAERLRPIPSDDPGKDAGPMPMELVVVTGQQIDRTLQDTKESVAVITAEDIDVRSLLEIEDALLQAANVAITSNGTFNVSIRGISRLSFASGGVGDLGTTFYDDVAITNNAVQFITQNLWDVDQVEFLRGPQSTNVGRNALSGAMVVRSVEPQLNDFEAAVRLEAANFATQAAEGMVNLPIGAYSALRITAERSDTDGYIDNITTGGDSARSEFSTIRARYLVEPSETVRAIVSLQAVDGEVGNRAYQPLPGGPLDSYESRDDVPGTFAYEGLTGSLNLQWLLSDRWDLQSITAFSEGDYDRRSDPDGTEVPTGLVLNPADQSNWSQELRASFKGDTVRGVVGLYYLNDDSNSEFRLQREVTPAASGIPPFLAPFYPETFRISQVSIGATEVENIALFTQWEKDFGEQLTLSLGFRFDRESSATQSQNALALDPSTPLPDPAAAGEQAEMMLPGSGAGVEAGVAGVNAFLNSLLVATDQPTDTEFDAFLPEVGLTYAVTPDVSVSAFYKRGYRAGGARIDPTGGLNEFDPEYLENFELSLRSQWLDDRLTVNANVYYGLWTDQQLNVPIEGSTSAANLTRTENAGESTIWGFEVESFFLPTDRSQLFISLGFASTEFDEFCNVNSTEASLPDCTVNGTSGRDVSGNNFALAPEWTFSFGGEHYFTERFYLQLNATYQDGSFADVENRSGTAVDSFFLVNGSIGYQAEGFGIRLYGRNLFDEFYELSRFGQPAAGTLGILPGTPREYGIILSKSFD